MELTREGQLLFQALGDGLHRVETALHEIAALRNRKDVVELSLSTAFVTHWLVPRRPAFHAAFPTVDLRFQLIPSNLRGGPGPVDLAMRMKGEHDAEYHSWHFAPELTSPCAARASRAMASCSAARVRDHNPALSDAHFDPQTLWGEFPAPVRAARCSSSPTTPRVPG
jgi:DNA-binding transcriptional LysR family regulator